MFSINVRTIEHRLQRYNTVGDWFPDARGLAIINVSDLGNWKYEALVAIHEFVEMVLCSTGGITPPIVDKWDMEHPDSDDPGSLEGCPYRIPHTIANVVERTVAGMMFVDWNLYEEMIEKVSLTYENKTINEKKEG